MAATVESLGDGFEFSVHGALRRRTHTNMKGIAEAMDDSPTGAVGEGVPVDE